MASSEYLSTKNSGEENALKSSIHRSCHSPSLPILPIWSFKPCRLGGNARIVVVIILLFTYYISVAKDQPFGRRFGEMALISLE